MHGQLSDRTLREIGYNQATALRKLHATPHDLGAPNEHPWEDKLHQLSRLQPVERFLPCDFVLQLTDFVLTGATDWELLGLLACYRLRPHLLRL